MKLVEFRFYEELNDFLPKKFRKKTFNQEIINNPKILDIIEKLGVPHSAIDLVLVNGQAVDFSYRLQEGDRISVYPMFEVIDISTISRLRPKPLRKTRFILDIHLGRLMKYLRIFGFNCYFENLDDDEIIKLSLKQHRIILTKDRGLLKDKKVTHGYWVRSNDPKKQLLEIMAHFDLYKKINFLSRCLVCNHRLKKISKDKIETIVSPNTGQYYDHYYFCIHCQKVYWEGSHYHNMMQLITFISNDKHKKAA